MRIISLSAALLALAQNALASPVNFNVNVEREELPALDVTLSQIGNTQIKAVVKNTGSEDVTFMHLNFFTDSAPVKKVSVFQNNTEVEFQGILRRVKYSDVSADSVTTLAPGASIEDVFDIATTTDLASGGAVTVKTDGFVPIVASADNKVTGYARYTSNELHLDVDGPSAATVSKAIAPLDRRTRLSSCSGSRSSALQTALRNTVSLANAAANAARSGSASKFSEYFKTTSSSVRSTVAARFSAVASEASSTSSGSTTYYCDDPYGYCSTDVLAYTLPSYNIIANCDIYYSYLPALTGSCHAQDQATTTLHEFTHAPGVYSPGTEDYGYGYNAATSLSTSQAVLNADSYALYANAIYLGC